MRAMILPALILLHEGEAAPGRKLPADLTGPSLKVRLSAIKRIGAAMKWIICVLGFAAASSHAGSIYLCKAYSGGTFWANTHCNQHSALIERIVSVPDSLPFNQQVHLGEQDRARAAAASSSLNQEVNAPAPPNAQAECKSLDAQIAGHDAMARQPQSGQMQDWIAAHRKKARDRQFALRCR